MLINNEEEKQNCLAKFYTSLLRVCNHLYTHAGSAIANLTHHSISLIPSHAHTTYNLPSCYAAGQCMGLWNQHPKGMKLLPSSCFLLMTRVQVGDLPSLLILTLDLNLKAHVNKSLSSTTLRQLNKTRKGKPWFPREFSLKERKKRGQLKTLKTNSLNPSYIVQGTTGLCRFSMLLLYAQFEVPSFAPV